MTEKTLRKYGYTTVMKLNKNYIRCKDCKKIGFNDDDSVCIYCGSKDTLRLAIKK